MKIFMTGATGYIGENLALALVARQYEVVALVRSPEKANALAAAGIGLVTGDLAAVEAISHGMQHCDAVIHLAAYARVWPDEGAVFTEVNVEGTRNIMEAAVRSNVKKVIITSTAGVYGPSPARGETVDENTVRTLPFCTAYEASKARAEEVARSYAAAGMAVIILSPARVYGPGRQSESNAINKLVCLYLDGKWRFLPGNGKSIGSYCYIDDVVEAFINSLHHGRSGESYLLGGENISYIQLFDTLRQLSGKNYRLYRMPFTVLLLVSRLLVLIARITGTTPLITPRWTRRYQYDWSISSRKACKELHYKITPLTVGLKHTIDQSCHERSN